MSNYNSLKNKILFGKYKLSKIIGKGSFGCVFEGFNILDNSKVAIKVESKKSNSLLLRLESNFLSILKGYGIPEVKSFGYHGNFYIMVQELLSYNLMQLKHIIKRFTLKDIAMMAIQIMDRIEYVHSKNLLHRDIKPENFVIGSKNQSIIYIIDFGISRKYRSSRTGKHLKFQIIGKMFGTVRYASYNASRGVEQSRRDDLESIGYMLIYLATGTLPWQGISLKDHDRNKKYLEMLLLKKYTAVEVICSKLPKEFIDYIKYCKNLGFEQDPDYEYLRNLFKSILSRLNEKYDMNFSWIIKSCLKKNKSKDIDINKDKYINFLRRRESPQTRLFRQIQKSLEKDKKNEKIKIEKHSEVINTKVINTKNNIILLQNNDEKSHSRGISEDNTNNYKLDIYDNLNISKDVLSYNSLLAHYNMNVANFQDENKLYEENITRINSIKNKKVINFPSKNNINSIKYRVNNQIELNSYNFNSKELIKKNLYLMNYTNININKHNNKKEFNISVDLNKNNLNIPNSIYNKGLRSQSEKIKDNFNKKNPELTNRDKKRQLICSNIYMNILNNIKKDIDSITEINNNINRTKKNSFNNNIINYTNNKQNNYIQKNKYALNDESFSFRNINVNQNTNPKKYNINKKIEIKKLNNNNKKNIIKYNTNNNVNYNNQIQKNKNINNTIRKNIINTNNNIKFNLNNLLDNKNINDNNNRINIIINNNVNSFNGHSESDKNILAQKKPNYSPNYNFNLIKMSKNNVNYQYINQNDSKSYNYIKKIPKNYKKMKEHLKIIPNITKPIMKNYFVQNQFNNTYDIKYINTSVNDINDNNINNRNINNNLNTYIKNKIVNNPKIDLLKYNPAYSNIQKLSFIENKSNDFNQKRINSYKNIKSPYENDNLFTVGKMKIIQLNNKNQIKISPQHYNNKKNLLMNKTKNIRKSPNIRHNNIYNNTNNNIIYNNNFVNDTPKYNMDKQFMRLDNPVPLNNNKKIYLNLRNDKLFRHYSPPNSNINNNLNYLSMKDDDINKCRNIRSNSNTMKKKCLNYNINYFDRFDNLNYIPKNINYLNTNTNNNIYSKCYNNMKV